MSTYIIGCGARQKINFHYTNLSVIMPMNHKYSTFVIVAVIDSSQITQNYAILIYNTATTS